MRKKFLILAIFVLGFISVITGYYYYHKHPEETVAQKSEKKTAIHLSYASPNNIRETG